MDPISKELQQELPDSFRILAVHGPTGAGKSRIVAQLVRRYRLRPNGCDLGAGDGQAVCSLPGLGAAYLEKLQSVGLNAVPSWLKPFEALSNGQRQRVLAALAIPDLESAGTVQDSYCCFLDDQTSFSCAASIYRLVRDKGLRHVVVATTRGELIPYLGADLVIEAELGRATKVLKNELPFEARKMQVTLLSEGLQFKFGQGCSGWSGSADAGALRRSEDYGRQATVVRFATTPKAFSTEVPQSERTAEAAHAFDYAFKGSVQQTVHIMKQSCLPGEWHIGALCGPSGTGKSVNMRNLGEEAPLFWSDASVEEQVDAAYLDVALLPASARLRRWSQLSEGERTQADVARRLAIGGRILVDEFTSVLDRRLAALLCRSVARHVRHTRRQLVVATIHLDVVRYLQPDWLFRSDSAELCTFTGALSCPEPPEVPRVDYFRPPERRFTLTNLKDAKQTKQVFEAHFAQHHYLKQTLPTMWGLLLRDEQQRPVGFHAVAWQTGHGSPREARVVILPEFQGMGLGTRLSDRVGQLCAESNFSLIAKTKHPRLGGYRNSRADLWRPTSTNEKITGSLASSLRGMKARKKLVQGQQVLAFAPPKRLGHVERAEGRRCYSHAFVGGKGLETPRKRKQEQVEEPSATKKRGRPKRSEPSEKKPRGRPRKKPES